MELALLPWLLFDPAREDEAGARPQTGTKKNEKLEKRLFCAACRLPVTDQDQRIAMLGAHAHSCVNPHGLLFHIGCFREAPGCAASGAATTEHTWFPGYAWRVAHCARCGTHLGWRFEGGDSGFYGLIVKRLTSAGPASN
jgi:hypothetical protein